MNEAVLVDAIAFDRVPFEVAVLDPDGLVLAANRALANTLAREEGSLRGLHLAELCGDQDEACRSLGLALDSPDGDGATCMFRGADGGAL